MTVHSGIEINLKITFFLNYKVFNGSFYIYVLTAATSKKYTWQTILNDLIEIPIRENEDKDSSGSVRLALTKLQGSLIRLWKVLISWVLDGCEF